MSTIYAKQWNVISQDSGKKYVVSMKHDGVYSCSCPHWIYRLQAKGEHCKHIKEVTSGMHDPVFTDYVLIPAAVSEVTMMDMVTFHCPLVPLNEHTTGILLTIFYDLLEFNVPWQEIWKHYKHMCKRVLYKDDVYGYIREFGRTTYGPRVEREDGTWRFDGYEHTDPVKGNRQKIGR